MAEAVAYFRGGFVPLSEAKVSIRAKALNYGLGCFEGIRGYWNTARQQLYIFRMEDHYIRLHNSCRILRIQLPLSVEELCVVTKELIRRNGHREDVYIRPLAYIASELLSPTLIPEDNELAIYTMPLADYLDTSNGITACVTSWTRLRDNMIPVRAKPTAAYLNSALARAEARERGCDEAIFLNANGFVSEGSAEHVFLVMNGDLVTPSTEDDNLRGITRATIAEIAAELNRRVIFRHVNRSELYIADEVFFCGTGAQITPVVKIDGRPVGNGRVGPVTSELQALYARVVRAEHPKYAHWCAPVYE